MALVEITIKARPIKGGRGKTIATLTHKDVTLDSQRVGAVLAQHVTYALMHALGIPMMQRHSDRFGGTLTVRYVYRGDRKVMEHATFNGFYTVREGDFGRQGWHTYARFQDADGVEYNVNVDGIESIEVRQ